MSADKYPSIFSRQVETIANIFLKSNVSLCVCNPSFLRNKRDLLKLGNITRIFHHKSPIFSRSYIFSSLMSLEQSRTSENISWLISMIGIYHTGE